MANFKASRSPPFPENFLTALCCYVRFHDSTWLSIRVRNVTSDEGAPLVAYTPSRGSAGVEKCSCAQHEVRVY